MECHRIITNDVVNIWNIYFDKTKEELFVPEFCVYLFVIKQGKLRLSGQNLNLKVTANKTLCLPPLPYAVKWKCSEKTIITICKIDAWYFISHVFWLNLIKVLPINHSLIISENQLIESLKALPLPKASLKKTAQIKEIITRKINLLSDKQVNRYLKSWFGLTLSKLEKVFEVEAFVKNNCGYGKNKTMLVNNVDYDSFHDYSHFGHTFKSVTGMTPEIYLANEGTVQSLFW